MNRAVRLAFSSCATLLSLGALLGCTTILGLDDLSIEGDSSSSAGAGAGAATAANASSGTSSQVPMGLVDGVFIDSIAIYQGVERPLMSAGAAASSDVPIISGRDALLRVFYTTDANYDGDTVLARLTIGNDVVVEASGVLGGASNAAQLDSTMNLAISGEQLIEPTAYRVELLQPAAKSSNSNAAAAYPATGQDSLPVQSSGPPLKLVLVPIRYDADGSKRLPDTSPEQLQLYRDSLYKVYPVRDVDVATTAELAWNNMVANNGSGWSQLLNAVIAYRQSNGAAKDEYYYGIIQPKSSLQGFCGGGCVAGLSVLAGPNDAMGRAGIGLGYSGSGSADTAVHEIGHQHGRGHTACNTFNGIDPSFPYADGGIGTLGYDLVSGQLVSPATHKDFMGYCDPTWVSDYQFKRLFNRIKLVNGADFSYPEGSLNQRYSRVSITSNTATANTGTAKRGRAAWQARWLAPIDLATPPMGEPLALHIETADGEQSLVGQLLRYTHIAGGIVLFQHLASPPKAWRAVVDGQRVEIARAR
jgi:hypothetical protein